MRHPEHWTFLEDCKVFFSDFLKYEPYIWHPGTRVLPGRSNRFFWLGVKNDPVCTSQLLLAFGFSFAWDLSQVCLVWRFGRNTADKLIPRFPVFVPGDRKSVV